MKKNAEFIAVWILWIAIVYCCTAFINLEFDCTKWIWQHRTANVLFGLVLGGWISFANAYFSK